MELGSIDGLCQLDTCRLHQGAVEGTAYCQRQGATFELLQLLTSLGYTFDGAADDQLAGGVVVGRDDDFAGGGNLGADVFNGLVVEFDDGGHGGGTQFAALLHGVGTGND